MSGINSLDASTQSVRQAIGMSVLRKAMHVDQETVAMLMKAGTTALKTEISSSSGVGSNLDLYL